MSSGDAMAHAAASIVTRDLLVAALGVRLDPVAERRVIRLFLVVVMLAAYVVAALYRGSLVMLLLSAFGAVVQFAPGVVGALYSERARGDAVLVGMVAGTLLTVALTAWPGLRPWSLHAGLYGLALNLALVGVGSARTSRSKGL
jgi:SSS family solute:Na+ symporter